MQRDIQTALLVAYCCRMGFANRLIEYIGNYFLLGKILCGIIADDVLGARCPAPVAHELFFDVKGYGLVLTEQC